MDSNRSFKANERHETRVNYLKKDKDQLAKRLEDVEERLTNIKTLIKSLLISQNEIGETEKDSIISYMMQEKNFLSQRIRETQLENEEAKNKSNDHRKTIDLIMSRENNIEWDFSTKFEAVLKESKEKEDTILRLSEIMKKLSKEFKELAKNRLSSTANPKEFPEMLELKRMALCRVLCKVREHSKFIEVENLYIEKNIESQFKELLRLNSHAKFPFKIITPLEDFLKPTVYNLVQGDIRAKVDPPPTQIASLFAKCSEKGKNGENHSKLEEKLIKIESLRNELKIAENLNQALKEDKNYLLSSASYHVQRKEGKQTTQKPGFQDSFVKTRKRVISNPLDYCLKSESDEDLIKVESKLEIDSDFSNELSNYSSVEDNYYEGPGDSIIDDILDI